MGDFDANVPVKSSPKKHGSPTFSEVDFVSSGYEMP